MLQHCCCPPAMSEPQNKRTCQPKLTPNSPMAIHERRMHTEMSKHGESETRIIEDRTSTQTCSVGSVVLDRLHHRCCRRDPGSAPDIAQQSRDTRRQNPTSTTNTRHRSQYSAWHSERMGRQLPAMPFFSAISILFSGKTASLRRTWVVIGVSDAVMQSSACRMSVVLRVWTEQRYDTRSKRRQAA